MISLIRSFQIILTLSAVWTSFTSAPLDSQGYGKCCDAMNDIFKYDVVEHFKAFGDGLIPITDKLEDVVKFAIRTFKFGVDNLHDDVVDYFGTFGNGIIASFIFVPPAYCITVNEEIMFGKKLEIQKCIDALSGFGDKRDYDNFQETGDLLKYQNSVIISALYENKQITEENAEQYKDIPNCYLPDTYGHKYLEHICDFIRYKYAELKPPELFCRGKYGIDSE